jgi:uncharacterized integral membrane protein
MDHGDAETQPPGPDAAAPSPPASPVDPAPARRHGHGSDKVGPTRLSGAWTAAVVAIVLVVAMLIFILQNGREVPINFMSAHAHLPLGVAMLFAAVVGAVIVVGCGAARILQLRRVAKRRARALAPRGAALVPSPNVPPPAGPPSASPGPASPGPAGPAGPPAAPPPPTAG